MSGDFFSKSNVFKKVYDTNDSDTDQNQHSVNPHLGPNCFQRLSEDNMSPLQARRKQLQIGGTHKKQLQIGGAHIIFFKMTDHFFFFFFFVGGGGGSYLCKLLGGGGDGPPVPPPPLFLRACPLARKELKQRFFV